MTVALSATLAIAALRALRIIASLWWGMGDREFLGSCCGCAAAEPADTRVVA